MLKRLKRNFNANGVVSLMNRTNMFVIESVRCILKRIINKYAWMVARN